MRTTEAQTPPYRDPSLPTEERVADLLARMTLEEKVAQLHSAPWEVDLLDTQGRFSREKADAVLKHGILHVGRPGLRRGPRAAAEYTNAIQRYLVEETRLGIPALFHEEALHGFMGEGATSFPQAIALGCTWNAPLVRRIYAAAALETRVRGGTYVFAPDLDLARDPRWGRTEETFGEDPVLVARMGVAAVLGLQGEGPRIDADHVAATAKHFVAHGQPESGINTAPTPFGERELRTVFLPPFEAAVRAGVHSVMASYNEIDGIPTHVNPALLIDVLRRGWGFEGMVTSDGWAVDQLEEIHHVASSAAEAARLALEAGVDTEVEDGSCYGLLTALVREGALDETRIDTAVARVLRTKFLMGLFEHPFSDPDRAEQVTNSPEHRALALEAARQAIVLLKNDGGTLPLQRSDLRSLAVIGPNADGLHLGSYTWEPGHGVTALEGLRTVAGAGIQVRHAVGCRFTEGPQDWRGFWQTEPVVLADPREQDVLLNEAVELARVCDAAVVVVGDNEATCREAFHVSHLGDRADLRLLGRQEELVLRVIETGTPTVVVLIGGRPLALGPVAERAAAIIQAWYPGQEGGTALAEIIFGDVNPSARLTITFPRSVGHVPAFYNHKPSARRGYLFEPTSPVFPFGHGLSYTTFAYSAPRLNPPTISAEGRTQVSVEVTNTGHRDGEEVVQLYIRDVVSSVTRPVRELKDFQRVALAAGETRTVTFDLGPEALSLINRQMEREVEPGEFEIMVGGTSDNLQSTVLTVVS